jgi:hypothetical protein
VLITHAAICTHKCDPTTCALPKTHDDGKERGGSNRRSLDAQVLAMANGKGGPSPLAQVFSSQTAAHYVAATQKQREDTTGISDVLADNYPQDDDSDAYYLPCDLSNEVPLQEDAVHSQQMQRVELDSLGADSASNFPAAFAPSSPPEPLAPLRSAPLAAAHPALAAAADPQLLVLTQLVQTLQTMQKQSAVMQQQSAVQSVRILQALQSLDPSRRTARQISRRHNPDAATLADNLRSFLTNQASQRQGQAEPPIINAAQNVFGMELPAQEQQRQQRPRRPAHSPPAQVHAREEIRIHPDSPILHRVLQQRDQHSNE